MPVLRWRKRSRGQILPKIIPSCILGSWWVRTGKDFLAHKGESLCFRCVQKKKLGFDSLQPGRGGCVGPHFHVWRAASSLGSTPLWGCTWLAACVEVEWPGCFPTGFRYQSLPNGIPESVERGRGRNNLQDKLHCVGGWRLSEWPQEGVRRWHVIFEQLRYFLPV